MNNKKKIFTIIVTVIVILLIATVSVSFANSAKAKEVINLGNKYLADGKYQEAIIEFEKAITIDKKNVQAYIGAAEAYINTNNIDKAEEVLNIAIENIPNKPDVYIELSDIYINEDKIQEAIDVLDKGYDKTKDEEIKNKVEEIVAQLELLFDKEYILVGTTNKLTLVKKKEDGTIIPVNAQWTVDNKDIADFIDLTNEDEVSKIEEPIHILLSVDEVRKEENIYTDGAVIKGKAAGKVVVKAKVAMVEKAVEVEIKDRVINNIVMQDKERYDSGKSGAAFFLMKINEGKKVQMYEDGKDLSSGFVENINYEGGEYAASYVAGGKISYGSIGGYSTRKEDFEKYIFVLDENDDVIETEISVTTEGPIECNFDGANLISGTYDSPGDYKIIVTVGDLTVSWERKYQHDVHQSILPGISVGIGISN